MRKLLLCLVSMGLAGCVTQPSLIERRPVTVQIPTYLFEECKEVKFPDSNALTDADVVKLIKDLSIANKQCKAALDSIHSILNSEATIFTAPTQ